MQIITLTTDFGSSDPFFGIMKGVILNICPNVRIEDISHDIHPQDIWQANFVLQATYYYFPKNTIHVCVVDPGVGSTRKPVLIESKDYYFIGPDNGLFTGILEREEVKNVIELTEEKYWLKNVSQTFHGRDIFSPVAAHLVNGIPINSFGKLTKKEELILLPIKKPVKNTAGYTAIVQFIDHFGNIITNLESSKVPEKVTGKIKDHNFEGLVNNFSEAKANKLTAIKGSSGYMEIFVNKSNAAKATGAVVGDTVEVKYCLS